MSSSARIVLLASAVAVGAALLVISARYAAPKIEPGTTVLATQEEGIRSITYRAGSMTLIAHRTSAGPFDIQVAYSDGRARQRCRASQDLAGLLPDLGEIEAKRQLTSAQLAGEFPIDAGTIELEDSVDEPISPLKVHLAKDRSAVALEYSGLVIEADMSPSVLAKLESGCAGLAGEEKTVQPEPQR